MALFYILNLDMILLIDYLSCFSIFNLQSQLADLHKSELEKVIGLVFGRHLWRLA